MTRVSEGTRLTTASRGPTPAFLRMCWWEGPEQRAPPVAPGLRLPNANVRRGKRSRAVCWYCCCWSEVRLHVTVDVWKFWILMGFQLTLLTLSLTDQNAVFTVVTCPPPEAIERGFVTGADHSQYGYMETVVYGCQDDFVLDGNLQSICQQDGKWSEKPSCNGRSTFCDRTYPLSIYFLLWNMQCCLQCQLEPQIESLFLFVTPQSSSFVPSVWSLMVFFTISSWFAAPCNISIERGRILYKDRKLWIEDLKPNRILHNEMVSFYCMNKARNCSYLVRTQCSNGRLDIPECFEGKGHLNDVTTACLLAAILIYFMGIRFKDILVWEMFPQFHWTI